MEHASIILNVGKLYISVLYTFDFCVFLFVFYVAFFHCNIVIFQEVFTFRTHMVYNVTF